MSMTGATGATGTAGATGTPLRYAGPPTPRALAARLGVPPEHLCKLDANESPYGPPSAALAALASLGQAVQPLLGAGRYPDPSAAELRETLARYTGVDAEHIVIGNGSDELIHLLVELLLEPGDSGNGGDEVVVVEPTFGLYALASRRRGARVVDAGCDRDFGIAPERITAAMTPRTRLVFLCSPNNPTGTPLPRQTLLAALERAEALSGAREGPLVIVDEAYYEIGALAGAADAWSAAPLVRDHPQLVVLRTFSKLFGLAGLRVGYALWASELVEGLRALKQPFNVNVAGQVAALAALEETDWLRQRALALVAGRERLARELGAFGQLRVFPSTANFLLVEVFSQPEQAGEQPAARWLWEALLDRGVMVRRFADAPLASYLRVTVGTPEQNDRLLTALRDILGVSDTSGTTDSSMAIGAGGGA